MPPVYYGPLRNTEGKILPKFKDELQKKRTNNTASWDLRDIALASPVEGMNRLHVLGLNRCFQLLQARTNPEKDNALIDLQSKLLDKVWRANMLAEEGGHTLQLSGPLTDWFRKHGKYDCSLIMLEQKDYDTYSKINSKGDLQYGQHTVCAVTRKTKLKKPQDANSCSQYLANLILKINMKMEGEPHFPDQATLNKIVDNERHREIVSGADVTHPVPGSKLGSQSIACVIGSVDKTFMQYPGSMGLQTGGQKICRNSTWRVLANHPSSKSNTNTCAA
jgi:hypothetical protein